MQFEITIEDDLLHKVTNLGLPVHTIIANALWIAVDAAETAQELTESVEPAADEEAPQEPSDKPYTTSRSLYSGASLYDIVNTVRRENRKIFGRRAHLTVYPDGRVLPNASGGVTVAFIVEVRYPKNSLFQSK